MKKIILTLALITGFNTQALNNPSVENSALHANNLAQVPAVEMVPGTIRNDIVVAPSIDHLVTSNPTVLRGSQNCLYYTYNALRVIHTLINVGAMGLNTYVATVLLKNPGSEEPLNTTLTGNLCAVSAGANIVAGALSLVMNKISKRVAEIQQVLSPNDTATNNNTPISEDELPEPAPVPLTIEEV